MVKKYLMEMHAGKMYLRGYCRPEYTQYFSRTDNRMYQRINKLDMGQAQNFIFSTLGLTYIILCQ